MPLDITKLDNDWPEVFAVACAEGSISIDPRKDIEEVIASIDGENDGLYWQAIIKLKDGKYAWISSWCDYTGWGCQDGGTIHLANSLKKLLNPFVTPIWLREDLKSALIEKGIKVPENVPLNRWDLDKLLSKIKQREV